MTVPAKSFDRVTTDQDVWVFTWAGAGGYGDPLEREPTKVLDDVCNGRVSPEWARECYGVVTRGSGDSASLDTAATAARREEIVAQRLAQASPWPSPEDPDQTGPEMPPDGLYGEYIEVRGGEWFCGDVSLGPANRNYKMGTLFRERQLTEVNPRIRDPSIYVDHTAVLREYICPGTGRLIDAEIVVDGGGTVVGRAAGQSLT